METSGREATTHQWRQGRKWAGKECVCTPSPSITSTRKAAFVGKGEEGGRGGDKRGRKKQASKLPPCLHPATNRRTRLKSTPRPSSGARRGAAQGWPPRARSSWRGRGGEAAGAQPTPVPGPHEEALTLALAPAQSCIWHQVCLHL